MTASLQGEIRIRTRSIDEAIDSINRMGRNLRDLGKQDKGVQQLSKEFENNKRAAASSALALRGRLRANEAATASEEKLNNVLAKASNTVANFSQRVEQSGISQEKQNQIIGRARQELERYRQMLFTNRDSTVALQTANTQLSVGLGELGRELKDSTQGGVAQERTLGTLQVAYERLNGQIKASGMSEERKAQALRQTNQAYQQARSNIQTYGRNSIEATKAQTAFRSQTASVTQAIKTKNAEMRNTEMVDWRKQMTDLTGSVQLALGPLSGVASRITALTGLFKRNAAPIAALVASFTGFAVSLTRTISVGREAERQMMALDAQVEVLGLTAVTSGGQLNDMARRLADTTLSSAQEMRGAQSALMEFRNIGVSSFEDVLLTAQGLSQTVEQGLSTSIRQLGRLLNDPISNFDALSRAGIQFNDVEKERITTLVNTGRLQQAQNEILERFNGLQRRATEETGGLSGQLDALGDNTAMVAEKLFFMGGTSEQATRSVSSLADAVRDFGESDAALGLAETFGNVIAAAARSIEFLVDNINVVSAAITGLLVMGISRAIVAITTMITKTQLAIGIKAAFTKQTMAEVAATTASTRATEAKTVAVTRLGRAIRIAIPLFGIAITALEVFGAINLFSPSQSAQLEQMQDSVKAVTDRAVELQEALDSNSDIDIDTKGLSTGQRMVEHFEEELQNAIETRDELERPILVGGPGNRDSEKLAEYNDKVEEADRLIRRMRRSLDQATYYLKVQTDSAQKRARTQQEAEDAQNSYNQSLERAIRSSRSLTDSEGSRIDSVKEQIETLQDLINNRDEGIKLSQEEREVAEREIELLKERLVEMRNNSRANREAERSALRLIRIQGDVQEQLQRTEIFTNSASETQAEYNLRMVDAQREVSRYTERVRALSQTDRLALAETLNLTEAQKLFIASSGGSAESVQILSQALAKMSFESKEAERDFRAMVAAQDVMNQLQSDFDPMAGLNHQIQGMAQSILEAPYSDEEQAAALEKLNAWFELERDTIMRQQERLKEDTMRFHPLTETEQLQRDFEDRQSVLEDMYVNEEEKLKEHLATLEKEYAKQKFFTQMGEQVQQGAELTQSAMDVMSTAGREQTREYQAMAIAQATMAQGVAIAKAWQEGGPIMGPVLAGLAAAQLGAQIASIRSQSFNTGGFVQGKGTGKSDSIPANLSSGEFVLQKSAVDTLGIGLLNRLNNGEIEGFSTGGFVARNVTASGGGSNSSRSDINVQVIDQSTRVNGVDTEVREEANEDGERQLRVYVRDAVRDLTNKGEFDRTQRENFGNKRRGIRR